MIGRTLRQYFVTEKLGEGGMGVVWKARDTMLDRDVALKVLSSDDSGDGRQKERFFREAKAASALNHPNIITIYEINADQGVDYIAMEYVAGETLSKALKRGPMPIERVVEYATHIAEAVGRAHSAGIVHRDLKPGNVMLTDDGRVKVLDFGVAKMRAGATADAEQPTTTAVTDEMPLTRIGTALGTVGYMSPEQAIGDSVDARSDVFSFGVILYRMLTGALPFAGDTQLEVLQKVHFADPPSATTLRADTPPFLAAILARALAKKPADRYANLTEVAAALRDGTTATTPSPGRRRRLSMPAVSRRTLAAVMAAVAVMMGAGVISRWVRPSASANLSTAAQTPYQLTQQAAAFLARDDKNGNPDRAIALIERALQNDQSYALAHAYLADAYRRKHQVNPDAQLLNLARESAERAVTLNPDLAAGHVALGFVHIEDGQRDKGIEEFRRAADLDPVNPLPHAGLGVIFSLADRDREAEAAFTRAIELGPGEWRPYRLFGDFFYRRARYAEAAAQWETARRLTPDNVVVLRNLGPTYYQLGRYDEAASTLQRAIEIEPAGPTYTNLGTIRFFQGRYADAVVAFEKAVELGANRYVNWGNLGDAYRWAPGRRADAGGAYSRASELIAEQIAHKPQDPDLRTRHALYLAKMGDRAAALKEVEAIPSGAALTAQMLYRLMIVREVAGDRQNALSMLDRALEAGYPVKELENEPELISLRSDARYHRLIGRF